MPSKTILTIACLFALSTLAKAQEKANGATHSSETDILTVYNGPHNYKLISVAGKTTEAYIDDKRVADNEMSKYDSLIQAMARNADGDSTDQEEGGGSWDQEGGSASWDQERGSGSWDQGQAAFDRQLAGEQRRMMLSLIRWAERFSGLFGMQALDRISDCRLNGLETDGQHGNRRRDQSSQ